MLITYWSDYACPFCYIGERRLKKAIADIPELQDAELEMKAFELDPTFTGSAFGETQERFARKYGISLEEAGRTVENISRMGRDEGIDFRYATSVYCNTMDAHRLTKFAASKGDGGLTDKVIERLFAAYYTDNLDVSDPQLLLSIGEECGLDPQETAQVLNSDLYKDEVILDEREAARYRIQAVPFFIIGRYGLSGAQPVETFKEVILKAFEEEKEAEVQSGKENQAAQGLSCGPDGCK